jgi:hypothetical protein
VELVCHQHVAKERACEFEYTEHVSTTQQ